MTRDIAPDLLNLIKGSFENNYNDSEIIKNVINKVESHQASYQDAHDYAIEVGNLLSRSYQTNLHEEMLPNGRMYYNIAQRVIEPTMTNNYELVTDLSGKIQEDLTEQVGFKIKNQKPVLEKSRIDSIIDRVANEEKFSNIKWILDEPIVTFTQHIVDEAIKANVDFQAKSGLNPKIIRHANPGACEWCRSLVGTYDYGEEPPDVYRRHSHCRCKTDYYPGNRTKQNVHTKKREKISEREEKIVFSKKGSRNSAIEEISRYHALKMGYNPIKSGEVVRILRNDSKLWINSLSFDEKNAIKKYTYNGTDSDGLRLFEKINGYLGNYYNPINDKEEEMLIRFVSNIDLSLLKYDLSEDIIVYRNDSLHTSLDGEVSKYLSSSATKKGVLGQDINVSIIVPKGTPGAYIELLSDYKKQREFLISRGVNLVKLEEHKGCSFYTVKGGENNE